MYLFDGQYFSVVCVIRNLASFCSSRNTARFSCWFSITLWCRCVQMDLDDTVVSTDCLVVFGATQSTVITKWLLDEGSWEYDIINDLVLPDDGKRVHENKLEIWCAQ